MLREEDRPLLVTALLRTGVSMDLPYGLDLAGLLAARMRVLDRGLLHEAGRLTTSPLPDTTQEEPEDMNLPLGTCSTAGEQWHWLASCALPVDPEEHPEPRTYYCNVDGPWAQVAAARPLAYHHPSKGPYRDMMMPAPVVVCRAVQWRAVGDAKRVEELLRGMRFVGRRRSVGEGGVLDWNVEEVDADEFTWCHVREAEIIRPCPEQCAQEAGVAYRMGWYALRPPSWHPDRLVALAMTPEPEEEW